MQISDFDCEMRRRVWCVLNTWDWQLSMLLNRPRVIDPTDCDVGLPSLTLEAYSPSPLLYMKLHSELIGRLSSRFGAAEIAGTPAEALEYMGIIEHWMAAFPQEYNINNCYNGKDTRYSWIVLHRYYLHILSYVMMLKPLRPFLSTKVTIGTAKEAVEFRDWGVKFALELLNVLLSSLQYIYPDDTQRHVVRLYIFDVRVLLCSAVMNDESRSIQDLDEILMAVNGAIAMLHNVDSDVGIAKSSYKTLMQVVRFTR